MGGIGSGNRWRWDKKATCEEHRRVDVRYMRRRGLLYEGAIGTLSWGCRGEPSGWIQYRIHDDTLILIYRYRCNGGDWEPVEQRVTIDRTPCHYGGYRPWWHCPDCGRRVAVLYGAGKYFLCRHCYGLSYITRQEDWYDRRLTKAGRIREWLGGYGSFDEPFPPKPKGMHWKTYERLRRTALEAEEAGTEKLHWLMVRLIGLNGL